MKTITGAPYLRVEEVELEGVTQQQIFICARATLVEYSYVQYKESSGAIGYSTKLLELRQFFTRAGRSEATPAAPDEA